MGKKVRAEDGEVIIESMIVSVVTMFVLIFLISLGFLFYQQWNVQYIADDIAGKAAVSYCYKEIGLEKNEITAENMEKRALYRYVFATQSYNASVQDRGKAYGQKMLKLTNLAKPVGKEQIEISNAVTDGLARRHITSC